MYRLILVFALLVSSPVFSQDTLQNGNKMVDTQITSPVMTNTDHRRYKDSVQRARETSQGPDHFLRYQREQKGKQKKGPLFIW